MMLNHKSLLPFFLCLFSFLQFFSILLTSRKDCSLKKLDVLFSQPKIHSNRACSQRPGQILAAKINASYFKSVKSKSMLQCTSGQLGCVVSAQCLIHYKPFTAVR